MSPGGRKIHPGAMNLLGFNMEVVGFIRNRSVHSSAPWGWSGSSGVIGVRSGDGRVHPVSLGTLGSALRYVHCCWVHLGVVGFVRVRLVHWIAPWWS